MQGFINPEELNTLLDTGKGQLLLIFLNKHNPYLNQQQTLEELFGLFKKKLKIVFLDIEYQNSITEKFAVHGFPAFIFCEHGRKQDVLLGTPAPEILREFVIRNIAKDSTDQTNRQPGNQ